MPDLDTSDQFLNSDTDDQIAPNQLRHLVPEPTLQPIILDKPEIVRKNIEVRAGIKNKFENIANKEGSHNQVTVPALLRNSLVRMLTLWWLHYHNQGTFSIKFPSQTPKVLVHEFLLPSISLTNLDLTPDELNERDRVNLSVPKPLLDELEKIAAQQDKVLTGLMRDSFHLELLLYKLRDEGGEAYINLKSGKKIDVVKNYTIHNPSPKLLLRIDNENMSNEQ